MMKVIKYAFTMPKIFIIQFQGGQGLFNTLYEVRYRLTIENNFDRRILTSSRVTLHVKFCQNIKVQTSSDITYSRVLYSASFAILNYVHYEHPTMGEQVVLIKQGAEAKIYSGNFHGKPCIVKERFAKAYRHPDLDREIVKDRLRNEVRSLVRCRFAG